MDMSAGKQARFFAAQAIREQVEIKGLEKADPACAIKLQQAWKVQHAQLLELGRSARWRDYVRCIYVYCKLPHDYAGGE